MLCSIPTPGLTAPESVSHASRSCPCRPRSDGPRPRSPDKSDAVLAAPEIGLRGQTFTRTTAAGPFGPNWNRRESTSDCNNPERGQLAWREVGESKSKKSRNETLRRVSKWLWGLGIGIDDEGMVQHASVVPSPRFYILTLLHTLSPGSRLFRLVEFKISSYLTTYLATPVLPREP